MTKEYSVLQGLPDHGRKCLAFGHKTFCCECDMEKEEWHEVIFKFVLSEYKLKKEMPEDIEESIMEFCNFRERWEVLDSEEPKMHLIGVTKWKYQL